MWYYIENDLPVGPISENEFQMRRMSGKILPQTPVWRKGMVNWMPLECALPDSVPPEINGNFSPKRPASDSFSAASVSASDAVFSAAPAYSSGTAYTSGTASAAAPDFETARKEIPSVFFSAFLEFQNREMKKINFLFWGMIFSYLLIILFLFLFLGLLISLGMEFSLIFTGVCYGITIIFFTVFFFMFIYHLWRVIPQFNAYTTPGKAVLYMFIPFFNIVWQFLMFYHLTVHLDELGNYKRIPHEKLTGFTMTVLILGFIPYVGMLNIFLMPILFYKVKKNTIQLLAAMTAEDYFEKTYYAKVRANFLKSAGVNPDSNQNFS